MPAPTRRKLFDIVGESYDTKDGTPRQNVLARVDPGDRVTLEREPDNPRDPNAVAVVWKGYDIGYLPREDASTLASALDAGREHVAQVHEIKGGMPYYPSYGVRISIAWDGKSLPMWQELNGEQEEYRERKLKALKRTGDDVGGGCFGVLVGLVIVGTVGFQFFA
ncbi:HIRAN domain-containing protein [Altererythrobacter litoralis]|uniref:HIRAN domain-containing protein n=1 Tax=Altererythrobacter litoralis TaxID=3113904 RepID=A0ABU7GFG3_9SPHN|nr:HIRAN domain-containing protein [Erythrobacteraceae bacterium 1XM1-14]